MLHFLFIAWLSGHTLDTASTVHALLRGHREANLLLPSTPTGIVLFKSSTVAAVSVWTWRNRHRRPKLVRAVWVAGAITGFAAATHNIRAVRAVNARR